MKVAVIGGGPAGLATLKFLSTAHHFFPIEKIRVRLFEAHDSIGGTFVQRIYEDAELVSSKYLTAFSDFRLPPDAPDFVTPQAYVKYLGDYVKAFGVDHLIELRSHVKRVCRGPDGTGHTVHYVNSDGGERSWTCDAVAVCSGLHVHPRMPKIPGIERVPVVLHSSRFKTRAQFGKNTNVVVCGAGETGMDIAHLAVTSPTTSVTMAHRDGFFCAPKIIPIPLRPGLTLPRRQNKPVDTSVASLFDTAYAHPVLQRSPLLWLAYDQWVKKMHVLISGTEEGPDQWVGQMSPDRKKMDSIFLCKSARALPYISEGHRSESWWNRQRTAILNVPIMETNGRRIDVVKWPTEIDKDGYMVIPDEGRTDSGPAKRIKPDVMVLATGYDTNFYFLEDDYPGLGDTNARGVYKYGDVTVGFVGFVRPAIGAIPPLAELQAQFWVYRLLQSQLPEQVSSSRDSNALESYELDYKLHACGEYDFFSTKRGVDHEAYAYQLALDMGSAPTMSYVMSKGWKLFFTWAMGSNFNPKFRLVGPWKWEAGAEKIMCGELYSVVSRSGGFLYLLTYSLIPFFFFGLLSGLLYALCWLLDLIGDAVEELLDLLGRARKSRAE
ncbi:dimethylaniline monooxygenase [Drechmeria coniospora]|uniref:Dimethylaniline monooxygenase n=1 Tax=Drechmeria coniospora TaxID=98403 RepID=A0A151GGC9_DRECN|nr:dimethylaniline monooxygenase [Drechmeria coniospora]KYK56163.1 dimethylaniline monooxygenase [Drechmeria coniospora]